MSSGEGAEGDEHGVVYGSCVVEEDADDFLESFCFFFVEAFGCVELDVGSVIGLDPVVWGVFWFGWCRMFEALEGSFYVAWHGYVASPVCVVPV